MSQSHHAGSPTTAQNCFQNFSRPSLLPPPENLGRYFESLWPVMRRRPTAVHRRFDAPHILEPVQLEGLTTAVVRRLATGPLILQS